MVDREFGIRRMTNLAPNENPGRLLGEGQPGAEDDAGVGFGLFVRTAEAFDELVVARLTAVKRVQVDLKVDDGIG